MLGEWLIISLSLISTFIVWYFRHAYKYWERKGVGFLKPRFPLGNSISLLPTSGLVIGIGSKKYYDDLKGKGLKFGGIYLVTEPNLVLTDPDYVRDILTKDFQHFVDRGVYFNEKDDPLSFTMFAATGTRWRHLRLNLTPTFTSGKMRMMFQTVMSCSDNMTSALNDHSGKDLEILEILARFTIDVIGSVAFGIDCNSFENPDAEFRRMCLKSMDYDFWLSIKAFFATNMPNLCRKFGVVVSDREVIDFFVKSVRDVIDYRKNSGARRNDFIQILIDLNKDGEKITFNEIVAQVFLFFIAGFDTSSTTMNFALYELSKDSKMQNKLRDEINMVLAKHGDQITYDSLHEMEYLDQIVSEALRKYPSVPTFPRICTKDYKLRNTNIVIEEGTSVIISPFGLHRDPEYFPNPERFDPSRFSNEMKAKRHPYVYLPFGEGPRICIGLRFGLMQSKIGIVSIIRNFKLGPSLKTKPVVLDPSVFLIKTVDPILVKIDKI